jgi:hypothetical protein
MTGGSSLYNCLGLRGQADSNPGGRRHAVFKYGRAFRIDVPLEDIKFARQRTERRRWAIGVHYTGDGWLVNGSRHGIVELKSSCPVRPKKAPGGPLLNGPIRTLILSLTEPEKFIAALTSPS